MEAIQKPVFGVCGKDGGKCYPKGAICRLSPSPKHFAMQHKGQGKRQPLRNKECCHFKKDANTLSDWEKVNK